ncbi:MAG: hypothetical protein AB4372_21110 [Xenococcus sp. (in: cyanobacteria)]
MNQKSSKHSAEKNQEKQLTQLYKLTLEQLESIAGGPEGDPCPPCFFNPIRLNF